MPSTSANEPTAIFLNVPYDKKYERLFIAMCSTIFAHQCLPRLTLEVPDGGQGRLRKIHDLIQGCRLSFHDLSRVGTPARFNMPFELGLACGLNLNQHAHEYFILEAKPYRIQKTLSDINGVDVLVHNNTVKGMLNRVTSVLQTDHPVTMSEISKLDRFLAAKRKSILRNAGCNSLFNPVAFKLLAGLASDFTLK